MTILVLIASFILQYFDGDGNDRKLLITGMAVVISLYAMIGGVKSLVYVALYFKTKNGTVTKKSLNKLTLLRVVVELILFALLLAYPPYLVSSVQDYYKPQIVIFSFLCCVVSLVNDLLGREVVSLQKPSSVNGNEQQS